MRHQTVVVGYDGSADAMQAVDAAVDLTSDTGVVHVVTAFHPVSRLELARHITSVPEEFRYVDDPIASEKELQQPAIDHLRERQVRCEGHVIEDDPASAIIDVAAREGADLIVVGSRGVGAVTRFVRGSVSARIAAHAPVSVYIVHATRSDRRDDDT
jgi:nucleotide-binding universal stress UspA family protein